jgi:hypothetical protein
MNGSAHRIPDCALPVIGDGQVRAGQHAHGPAVRRHAVDPQPDCEHVAAGRSFPVGARDLHVEVPPVPRGGSRAGTPVMGGGLQPAAAMRSGSVPGSQAVRRVQCIRSNTSLGKAQSIILCGRAGT